MKSITRPTLLIDSKKVLNNIRRMKQKADESGVVFRPHFKTHQNLQVAEFFRQEGVSKITVSSVSMAEEFAGQGWKDITIAFPVNLLEMSQINRLSQNIQLNLLVDSLFTTRFLDQHASNHLTVLIKIDTGYHRTGLLPHDPEIDDILKEIAASPKLTFGGFLTHAGHTYQAREKDGILDIMEKSREQLISLKHHHERFYPKFIISYGDTPSCNLATHFHGFDEIRPGNFVYNDVMQLHLGVCSPGDIAVVTACPVVSILKEREELAIYGGAVHLSKEHIEADQGFQLYGYVVRLDENLRWGDPITGAFVHSLSQEHGLISMPEKELLTFKPGDLVGIMPVHSCLTANLLRDHFLII
ncbi:MAG: alanine racemase [Bacteroidetes bacterium HGW-Bacteroidetes-16]|jgi:D-serine deaminase-like pyridoxal phosphate-dependent protein|nr:MAG: alanine racemase [Bacteroidetes bacterium HGW-Bacteroidetes-16]